MAFLAATEPRPAPRLAPLGPLAAPTLARPCASGGLPGGGERVRRGGARGAAALRAVAGKAWQRLPGGVPTPGRWTLPGGADATPSECDLPILQLGREESIDILNDSRSNRELSNRAARELVLSLGAWPEQLPAPRGAQRVLGGGRSSADYAQGIAAFCGPKRLWDVAFDALTEMRSLSLERDLSVHAAVILSCGGSSWFRATGLLCDMAQQGLEPFVGSFRVIVDILEHSAKWSQLLSLLDHMERRGPEAAVAEYSSAIQACEKRRKPGHVQGLVASMDGCIYREQVRECEVDTGWTRALDLLVEMQEKRLVLDSLSYVSAIKTCNEGHQWKAALGLVAEMRVAKAVLGDLAHGAAILACARSGWWKQAVVLLKEMRQLGFVPSAELYEVTIRACDEAAQWEWAVGLLREMQQLGLVVNETIFVAAINACSTQGQWNFAVALLQEMEKAGWSPDRDLYAKVVGACERSRETAWAQQLRQRMLDRGWDLLGADLDDGSWEDLLEARVSPEEGDVQELSFDDYRDNVLACSSSGQWEQALETLNAMQRQGMPGDGELLAVVIHACTLATRWEHAVELLAGAQRSRVSVSAPCYEQVIGCCLTHQRSDIATALIDDMQDSGLDIDAKLYNSVLKFQDELPELPAAQRRAATKLYKRNRRASNSDERDRRE
eukprot:CAMPEP_0203923766 /NCGR_PEP_ID=MMETSP0359-20131031/63602_1 /ASSEMBLY_ACC=CAM_ASM_000338 /TAXON_ID=268821 /ORGANISM="Scrippsiella Hangoei, Strain SHTV-5" /LENGTH=667 /DNA_ID=CAMNT_0050851881 /DNA_START=44 /DNA_END=2044 /DNA_ORIENTATION=-